MRGFQSRWMFAVLALLASGCLLPQPDTPPVPPSVAGPMTAPQEGAVGGKADAMPNAGTTTMQPPPSPLPGALVGRVEGLAATAIAAVSVETGEPIASVVVGAEGAFELSAPAGRYWLELTADGQAMRVGQAIALAPGERRTLVLRVEGDRVTIEEQAPLVPTSPSPSPGNTATGTISH